VRQRDGLDGAPGGLERGNALFNGGADFGIESLAKDSAGHADAQACGSLSLSAAKSGTGAEKLVASKIMTGNDAADVAAS